MPSLGRTQRRHSKQSSSSSHSHRKGAPSVISTVSAASSNATITPKSALPSNIHPPKRLDAKPEPVKQVHGPNVRSPGTDDSNKENLDVFAFLEQEEDGDNRNAVEEKDDEDNHSEEEKDDDDDHSEEEKLSSCESSSSNSSSDGVIAQSQRSPRYSDLEVRAIQDGAQHTWGRGSLHSDSGISVRSGSPDQSSPIMSKLPTVFDESDTHNDPPDSYRMDRYGLRFPPDPATDRNLAFAHKHWPSLETDNSQYPKGYYTPSPPLLAQKTHDAGVELSEMSPRLPHRLIRNAPSNEQPHPKPSPTGYEFLASNIHCRDDTMLKPIYRKFETLNNRMLLFLQDEISEMEEQLKDLDNAIAHEERSASGRSASRRAEAKLPSQLQWHRLDLLGRSFAKVEQYNRALTSYGDMTKSLGPASHADISAYRSWIAKHAPMVQSESAFLNQDTDLISVSPYSAIRSDLRSGTALETPVIVVAFGLLSTIIVFNFVPQILARVVISAMVGVAGLCTLSPEVMNKPGSALNWRKAIATYAAVMGLLSVVVS